MEPFWNKKFDPACNTCICFKLLFLVKFSAIWLTVMFSPECNSRVYLLNVALSWDVPFYQPHLSWTYLCPPLCSSTFCWQHKVSICDSVKLLPTGFVMFSSHNLWYDLDWLQMHCYLHCDERSIATNEVLWPLHFLVCNWLLKHALWLFTCTFHSNQIPAVKFLAHL